MTPVGGPLIFLSDWKSLGLHERRIVIAAFLGWTLDAFDFFLLVFVLKDVANAFSVTLTTVTEEKSGFVRHHEGKGAGPQKNGSPGRARTCDMVISDVRNRMFFFPLLAVRSLERIPNQSPVRVSMDI